MGKVPVPPAAGAGSADAASPQRWRARSGYPHADSQRLRYPVLVRE